MNANAGSILRAKQQIRHYPTLSVYCLNILLGNHMREIKNTDWRINNFNFIRLLFATLVILSHSFELVDGNNHREPFFMLFNTLSLGEIAVDGFFLLSGFLIMQSWDNHPPLFTFLKNRVLRIYPAFIVASLICGLVVGPLGSNTEHYFDYFNIFQFIKGVFLLTMPVTPPIFDGQFYPLVNGSMWTIQYEFICYFLVAVLGIAHIDRRIVWVLLYIALSISLAIPAISNQCYISDSHFLCDDFYSLVCFLAFFCAGVCFYHFRHYIFYRANYALACSIILFILLFKAEIASLALLTCGAYLLFWVAFKPLSILNWFKTYPDISYGVYLYGWPMQKLLLWYMPSLSPLLLFLFALVSSSIAGLLSWRCVEQPFLKLKRRSTITIHN